MESSVTVAPSQSLNEASIVISGIEEKQSVAPSKSERCQKLQENRPEHFGGVDEGNFLEEEVLNSMTYRIQLFRKRLSEKGIKVGATTPKYIVGSFQVMFH